MQSLNTVETVDSTAPESVAMSIDKTTTPNKPYLLYAKGTTSLMYWRSRAVDASAWSAEGNFDDGQGVALYWIQIATVIIDGVIILKITTRYTFACES